MKHNHIKIQKLVLTGLFLALGYILPFLTGQIQQIGNMLLPMHLPVLLCGLIVGWKYGLAIGFLLPITRSLIFTMPPFYPAAIAMAFELATYGAVIGLLYAYSKRKTLVSLYFCLISSMLAGRAVWGIVRAVLTLVDVAGLTAGKFTFAIFLSGAFLEAIPGMILQLILIPAIMLLLQHTRLLPLSEKA